MAADRSLLDRALIYVTGKGGAGGKSAIGSRRVRAHAFLRAGREDEREGNDEGTMNDLHLWE